MAISVDLEPPDYAELHCLSSYSFLHGASQPEELVRRAVALGYSGLAITDECTMSGIVKAHLAAREVREHSGAPFRLVIGTEIKVTDGPHLVFLAPHRRAYESLCTLITGARRRCEKGRYDVQWGDLAHLDEVLVLWIPDRRGAHAGSASDEAGSAAAGDPSSDHPPGRLNAWRAEGRRLCELFPGRLWIALELFFEADDIDYTAELLALAIALELPMTAAGDVHMHDTTRQPLQDVMTAIRLGTTLHEAGQALYQNAERHLRSRERLAEVYPAEMMQESAAIAARCAFSLDELRYEYPEEIVPPHLTPREYLEQLTWQGAAKRWPNGVPEGVRGLLRRELDLISELRYEHFFLTVHDIVQYARSRNILCQGRGSAANSAVCYCLHVTEVDPDRMEVLFERFISRERDEPPDIDVDFEHERREEVIQYIYRRYGRHRAGLVATVITYRPRSAIRDVGKALGFDLALVDHLARSMAWWDDRNALRERFAAAGLDPESPVAERFLALVKAIVGFPRHLSQHVGGFVIARGALTRLVPVENAAMAERTVIQWEKDDLEALGLLKVDVLALGMLTAIRKSLDLVAGIRGRPLGMQDIPGEDPRVYEMLQRADSTGVFQVESRAQMSMLPRLAPACFYDLVIEVAIVRPGPIQGDMVHPYLRRRRGEEAVTYSSDAVKGVLERTLGVPIFQEQVIKLAMVAAGFSAGDADRLRRAMAAWRRRGGLEQFERRLIDGMLARGHDRAFAERVFAQIKGFGEYGFPESHAASFALLVYVSAWLKRHEPAAFCCALLNSLPMGFYSASQLIQDARRHGIEVRGVDVMASGWAHTLEPAGRGAEAACPDPLYAYEYERPQPAIRLGLRQIKGLPEAAAERIVAARRRHAFDSVATLARAAELDSGHLSSLAEAGALASLSGDRHQANWQVRAVQAPLPIWPQRAAQASRHAAVVMDAGVPSDEIAEPHVALPAPSAADDLLADYARLGLTLGAHPMALLRRKGRFPHCARSVDLRAWRHGALVRIAGLVTGRQRPGTATGVVFVTLEDETGNTSLVVWNTTLQRFRAEVLRGRLLEVKGTCERDGQVVHVIAGFIRDRSEELDGLAPQSRDFH